MVAFLLKKRWCFLSVLQQNGDFFDKKAEFFFEKRRSFLEISFKIILNKFYLEIFPRIYVTNL